MYVSTPVFDGAREDERWKLCPDSDLGLISYLGVPIAWPDGEIFGTLCVCDNKRSEYSGLYLRLMLLWRDVLQADLKTLAARQRAEEALQESEERFRTLVQFSFDVYWETDAQHRFIHQEFAEDLADAPASGSEIGKTRWEVPYLEPDEEAWRKHRETLDAHMPFRDFELARSAPDGSKRYVSVSGLPVFDEKGSFVGYRGVGRHITERRRAEEALRAMQAELAHANRVTTMGQLSASIAHEVNQPIAATVTNAQAALRWLRARPPRAARPAPAWRRGRCASPPSAGRSSAAASASARRSGSCACG